MKKAFSIFLALVFIFALTGTAIAEDNVPTFVISEATAAPGDEVRVTISIENNTEVASIQLEPQYDHDVLEWTDVVQGDYTGTWNPRVDKGFVNWFGINGHNVSFDGVFATLVFKVSENAAAGDYEVTVTYDPDNVYDQDEENVYFAIQAGKVTVTGEEPAEGPTFVISEATAAPGDEVRVTISIENNTEVASIQLEPQYDHDVLEWTDVEQGDYTGTWNPRVDKGFVNWFGINGHNVSNDGVFATLVFKVSENAAAGDYVVTVTYDEDNVFDEDEENVYFDITPGKVTVTEPETIADGYYLIGLNGWTVDTLTATDKFAENPNASGEYMIQKELAVGDEFKAVKVENGAIADSAWYPGGMNNNYVVDKPRSGNVTVYFRPNYDGGSDWHWNCLYIQDKPTFMTQSLLLSGEIGVRFYIYLPERLRTENTSVNFTITGRNGKATSETFREGMPESKLYANTYGFTYYVNTIQMADTITAELYNNGEKLIDMTYSVADYFNTFDQNADAYDVKTANLVKATADLGHYAQLFLADIREWSIGDGADQHAAMNKFYAENIGEYIADANTTVDGKDLTIEGSSSKIKKMAYKLDFESETRIEVVLTMKSGFSGTVTATADGTDCVVEQDENNSLKYTISVNNVKAHQLSHMYDIVITVGEDTFTINGSALSYVKMMLSAYSEGSNGCNAAIALCRYSAFADVVGGNPADAKGH